VFDLTKNIIKAAAEAMAFSINFKCEEMHRL